MCILGLPEMVYPVGLFGIDICSKGRCDRLDSAFGTAVCLLVKGGRWYEVNIEGIIEFSKEIRDILGSSIRNDFLGYSIIVVDLTYKYIDDITGCIFLFH